MQWNSEANSDDIVSDITFWTGADTTAYPLADRSRHANRAQDRIISLILKASGWKFDDTSNTSTEVLDVTTNLVSGTGKYATSTSWLKIGRVRVKNASGTWITLKPVNRADLTDAELVASGLPSTYHITGNWVYPRPIPNYSSSGGMEVQYQRGATSFVPGDTTKTPGFATHFHRLIALWAALDYCEAKGLVERAAAIREKIALMEGELATHYAFKDEPTTSLLVPSLESNQ